MYPIATGTPSHSSNICAYLKVGRITLPGLACAIILPGRGCKAGCVAKFEGKAETVCGREEYWSVRSCGVLWDHRTQRRLGAACSPCCVLFSLYNEKAAGDDQILAENWREDVQGIMFLSGLMSPTVGGFLSALFYLDKLSTRLFPLS
ncbi:hypothetical protein BJV74DRAFT_375295 [Russula compacta]|nr:hypothetical protein BJV74DRAFT_375295 [Russula compacta]